MNNKTILIIGILIMLLGCAVTEEPAGTRASKRLITKEDYGDLQLKPHKEEPVLVDYEKDGVYRQSIDIHKKIDPAVANQNKFIDIADTGPVDELKMHYENGAKVNFRNNRGETPLIKVLDGPFDSETFHKLEFLISVGAKLSFRGRSATSDNTSPLGVAIWNSSTVFKSGDATKYPSAKEILKLLVDAGADVSGLEKMGRTPLHIAALSDNVFAARLLLEAGAKVMPRDTAGKTPLDYAESGEMRTLLMEYGAGK